MFYRQSQVVSSTECQDYAGINVFFLTGLYPCERYCTTCVYESLSNVVFSPSPLSLVGLITLYLLIVPLEPVVATIAV